MKASHVNSKTSWVFSFGYDQRRATQRKVTIFGKNWTL